MKMNNFKKICIEDCLECLQEKRFDKTNNLGNFKLHDAARKYNYDLMKELLDEGKDPNLKDDHQRTVLHILLGDGFLGHLYEANLEDCVKLLLERKCDVNLIDGNGESPLSLAVTNAFESCALWLVEYGANYSVRTPRYKRMHSLSSHIAKTMPNVMMEILDSGVTLDYVPKMAYGKSVGEPEVQMKLAWNPVLQFYEEQENHESKLRKYKYTQREMSFLYSLLDVPPTTRNLFLTHPLVSAFLHMKGKTVSKNLKWAHFILGTYPILYMIFIYFLYFNRCKFEADSDETMSNSAVNQSFSHPLQQESTENPNTKQLCEITIPISISAYLLMLIVGSFGLVEVYVQFRVDARYLKSWRTWVIRASLVIMGLTLWPALWLGVRDDITWQYPIAALGTFFAWVMFLIQMELIPQVKIYLEMVASITLSVLKITVLFLPLLTGFYMGFNLMFFKIGGVMNFILMTVDVGSNEYEDMIESAKAKDNKAWFTIIAYVFTVAFIIVIAIVFMNFLLGVSINDIQELKHNAKVMALSNRVQNLFIIDLVFPTRYRLVRSGESSYFSYGPYDGKFDLPEDIRSQLTLLLKSKFQRSIKGAPEKSFANSEPLEQSRWSRIKNHEFTGL